MSSTCGYEALGQLPVAPGVQWQFLVGFYGVPHSTWAVMMILCSNAYQSLSVFVLPEGRNYQVKG